MKLQDYTQNKPVLETNQLILRPLRKEDVSDLKSRRNLQKVFIGVLFTNKIIKSSGICGYISLKMTAWQK